MTIPVLLPQWCQRALKQAFKKIGWSGVDRTIFKIQLEKIQFRARIINLLSLGKPISRHFQIAVKAMPGVIHFAQFYLCHWESPVRRLG
jgi:hypothetical protein